jgi:hypothetical protein
MTTITNITITQQDLDKMEASLAASSTDRRTAHRTSGSKSHGRSGGNSRNSSEIGGDNGSIFSVGVGVVGGGGGNDTDGIRNGIATGGAALACMRVGL